MKSSLSNKLAMWMLVLFAAPAIAQQTNKEGVTDHDWVRNAEIMINVLHHIGENYVDKVDPDDMMTHLSKSLNEWLDPYTSYMNEEESRQFEMATAGEYGGVGAVIGKRDGRILIMEPYRGTPSDLAGFKIGDEIIAVNSIALTPETDIESVSKRMRGTPNTQVDITIKSVIDGSITTKTVTRRRISLPAIPYYGMLGDKSDGVGYIRHDDFTQGSAKEFRTAVRRLITQGATSLVLDYRQNSGGIMQEAVDILGTFTPRGTEVVSIKGREMEHTYATQQNPLSLDIPLTVLISGGSASASEIVAGALQDLDRAVVVGERSFGKGLVQTATPVGYNSYLKYTTARYYIPSGRSIQEIDYSSHTPSSQKKVHAADSLRNRFHTAAGRVVYDGGGIEPDVKVEAIRSSGFAGTLYMMGLLDDFADNYYSRHHDQPFDFENFKLSDEEFALFAQTLKEKEIPFRSPSRRALEALEKSVEASKEENAEELKGLLESMSGALQDDTESNIERYRSDIEIFINNAIVLRFGYNLARIAYSINSDEQVQRAREILLNESEYRSQLGFDGQEQEQGETMIAQTE